MEITITTKAGKFVMKPTELADGFVDYAKAEPANVPAVKVHQWGTVLENFLSTYEEEVRTEEECVCDGAQYSCKKHLV